MSHEKELTSAKGWPEFISALPPWVIASAAAVTARVIVYSMFFANHAVILGPFGTWGPEESELPDGVATALYRAPGPTGPKEPLRYFVMPPYVTLQYCEKQ